MSLVSVNIHDPHNLGDQVCNPCDYVPALRGARRQDAWGLSVLEGPAIFGGGGLIHGVLEQVLATAGAGSKWPRVAWGIGHNQHAQGAPTPESYACLKDFQLVGLRDWGTHSHTYVPCPSCLSSAFDEPRPAASLPLVIYEHHEHSIPVDWWARMNNRQPASALPLVLSFLALGSVVLTNTWHGAYWAMLLDRPVVLWEPFSSRFAAFKHPPLVATAQNWHSQIKVAQPPPLGYLDECRAINRAFTQRVLQLLDFPATPEAS